MTTSERPTPWVELRSAAFHTYLYQKMVKSASPDATPGDVVAVIDKTGEVFGYGHYNPASQLAVRMLSFAIAPIDDAFWRSAIQRAADLRKLLRIADATDAYRLIHAEGDDLSGLVVDRYADVLAIEIFSLGMWRCIPTLLPILHEVAGTTHHVVRADSKAQQFERFTADPIVSEGLRNTVTVTENTLRFRVSFDEGHKTGFFCDQRDNRLRLAQLTEGADVLDVCCYSGGFGLYAKALGKAESVTCVDLDENAVAMARKNANLNQVRIDAVHADAFSYMRQMQTNGRLYDVLVLDPPKLIFGKREVDEGRHKYFDLNRLAAALVKPGGLMLSCSCSGALDRDSFAKLATGAIHRAGRTCQIIDTTGPGPDHPVSPRCDESSYLKALWLRIL